MKENTVKRQLIQWVGEFLLIPRVFKRAIVAAADFLALSTAALLAVSLRLGDAQAALNYLMPAVLAGLIAVPVMAKLGLYRAVLRYMGFQTLWTAFLAVTLTIILWLPIVLLSHISFPASAVFIFWLIATQFVATTRLLAHWLFTSFNLERRSGKSQVVIYGAGTVGQQLAAALRRSTQWHPMAFVDDDLQLQGNYVAGLPVFSATSIEQLKARGATKVLVAIAALKHGQRAQLIQKLEPLGLPLMTVPSLDELASGRLSVSDIRDVDVHDLLGRDAVAPRPELLSACIEGAVVMVTGAGGSIGSELCRQIVQLEAKKLVLLESSEYALYAIEQELNTHAKVRSGAVKIVAILGNVQERVHLVRVMKRYGVQTIYHAAAYKHVPLVESNVFAGLRNNVLGTWHCMEAAVESRVRNFVLISTDKAVRPTNVMGASKRLAELIVQSVSLRERASDAPMRCSMVRFGNVLGSSGSVVPKFREQIRARGPITITHPEITRYFMTIPEAVSLVIQSGSMGGEGDVFVLDMGAPVKIADLAKQMVHLAGLTLRDAEHPHGDIEIAYTGLRPGEKLYEELLIGSDVRGTEHPLIMRASESSLTWMQMERVLHQLTLANETNDYVAARQILLNEVNGYKPERAGVDPLETPFNMTQPTQLRSA